MAQFQLGSISTGTLKTEDLLPVLTYTMRELTHNPISNTSRYPTEAMANLWDEAIHLIGTHQWWTMDPDDSGVDSLLEDLTDALQELCPPFVYFGTLPGDGADFGFWPDIETIQEIVNIAECDASHGISCPDDSVIVQINDHGNVTVMDMDRNVLWSVV